MTPGHARTRWPGVAGTPRAVRREFPLPDPRLPEPRRGEVPARRDAFAPLLENPLAALLRQHDQDGAATHAVPTGGAPQAVTLYDDGR